MRRPLTRVPSGGAPVAHLQAPVPFLDGEMLGRHLEGIVRLQRQLDRLHARRLAGQGAPSDPERQALDGDAVVPDLALQGPGPGQQQDLGGLGGGDGVVFELAKELPDPRF